MRGREKGFRFNNHVQFPHRSAEKASSVQKVKAINRKEKQRGFSPPNKMYKISGISRQIIQGFLDFQGFPKDFKVCKGPARPLNHFKRFKNQAVQIFLEEGTVIIG